MPHGYNGKILHMHRSRSTWRAKVPYTGVVSDLRAGPLSTLPPPRDPSSGLSCAILMEPKGGLHFTPQGGHCEVYIV